MSRYCQHWLHINYQPKLFFWASRRFSRRFKYNHVDTLENPGKIEIFPQTKSNKFLFYCDILQGIAQEYEDTHAWIPPVILENFLVSRAKTQIKWNILLWHTYFPAKNDVCDKSTLPMKNLRANQISPKNSLIFSGSLLCLRIYSRVKRAKSWLNDIDKERHWGKKKARLSVWNISELKLK